MHASRRQGHHRSGYQRGPAAPVYWGWSPQSGQMEMMDLRGYVDSVRAGYDRALDDLYDRIEAMTGLLAGGPYTLPLPGPPGGPAGDPWRGGRGHGREQGREHRGHGHGRHGCGEDDDDGCGGCGGHHGGHGKDREGHGKDHGHHRRERGCADDADCRCECCIVDADVVVYARCGEIRVVPIEIENDTRKDREDVEVEVSEFRTSGGTRLGWKAALAPTGPLTIRGCSRERLELLVGVVCGRTDVKDPGKDVKPKEPARPAGKAARAAESAPEAAVADAADELIRITTNVRDRTGGVDSCQVGYVTIRVGGCLVRPIVVAVAVLPDDCGAYHADCSSCC